MSSHNKFAGSDLPFARLAVLIGLTVSGQAMAAGFAVQNQNGAGTATAFAGAAAVADDASTIYFNPAGMTYLPMGHSISVAGTLLHRSLKFDDRGSNALGPFPLGDEGGEGGGMSLIPAGYYSYAINDRFRIGVGVSATFGNKTDYNTTFLGRFQGNYVDLKALNINPSVAWRVNDQLSIGAGISFVKLEGDIQQQLPVSPFLPNARNRLEADDTAMGFNVGLMYQVTPAMRVGLSYRSKIDFRLKGEATATEAGPATGVTPAFARIELPDTFSVAVHHQITDRWEAMGDYTWTGWSSFKSLDVRNDTTGARLTNPEYDFRDSWRIGYGAAYKYTEALKLRFGVAFDKSPVHDETTRTLTLPDSDRYWVAIGARYALSPKSTIDVGYAHIFFDREGIDRRTIVGTTPTGQIIRGKFDTSADLLSVQYNQTF
ncbi:OmpP1/FadL family transporter [Methyloversatilis sp. XJ19-49]|uniref:OmpP1/FadL family transporter n=1 Tax=Methyloversatilis sp. XJ19-49 TaxID=2963429 RepID=UPI00211D0DA3|nr:OmpP1/FadL family transporter [Methyloversatilis sp. XJ19-49]MCQ9379875.1 OmpP1/FadL family transporter [Methyloversatilis sp. XJ19-49]